jgi:hypothetical protein
MSGLLLSLLGDLRVDLYLRSGDYAWRIFLSSTGDFIVFYDWPVLCSKVFRASSVELLELLLCWLGVSLEGWRLSPRRECVKHVGFAID